MDLGLTFASGRISGEGNDDVGPFIIAGRFDSADKECHWTKTYVGAHDVFYRGFRESNGIWGTWEILSDARGGFHKSQKRRLLAPGHRLINPMCENRRRNEFTGFSRFHRSAM
jgi:hypothetical protein